MITFQTDGVEMPEFDGALVRQWLSEVALRHGFEIRNLNYCFCGDKEILEANRSFLNHDYYTDIITFDYTRHGKVAGDLLISIDTVRSNAIGIGESYERELLRVLAHGLLHLCGINDKGPGEREVMETHENDALTLYSTLLS